MEGNSRHGKGKERGGRQGILKSKGSTETTKRIAVNTVKKHQFC